MFKIFGSIVFLFVISCGTNKNNGVKQIKDGAAAQGVVLKSDPTVFKSDPTMVQFKKEEENNKITKLEDDLAAMKQKYEEMYLLVNRHSIAIDELKKNEVFSSLTVRSEILFDGFPMLKDAADSDYKFAITSLEAGKLNDAKYSSEFIIDRYLKKQDSYKKNADLLKSTNQTQLARDLGLYRYTLYLYAYINYSQHKYQDALDTFKYLYMNFRDPDLRKEVALGALFSYDKLTNVRDGCDLLGSIYKEFAADKKTLGLFKAKAQNLHFDCQ